MCTGYYNALPFLDEEIKKGIEFLEFMATNNVDVHFVSDRIIYNNNISFITQTQNNYS